MKKLALLAAMAITFAFTSCNDSDPRTYVVGDGSIESYAIGYAFRMNDGTWIVPTNMSLTPEIGLSRQYAKAGFYPDMEQWNAETGKCNAEFYEVVPITTKLVSDDFGLKDDPIIEILKYTLTGEPSIYCVNNYIYAYYGFRSEQGKKPSMSIVCTGIDEVNHVINMALRFNSDGMELGKGGLYATDVAFDLTEFSSEEIPQVDQAWTIKLAVNKYVSDSTSDTEIEYFELPYNPLKLFGTVEK